MEGFYFRPKTLQGLLFKFISFRVESLLEIDCKKVNELDRSLCNSKWASDNICMRDSCRVDNSFSELVPEKMSST